MPLPSYFQGLNSDPPTGDSFIVVRAQTTTDPMSKLENRTTMILVISSIVEIGGSINHKRDGSEDQRNGLSKLMSVLTYPSAPGYNWYKRK